MDRNDVVKVSESKTWIWAPRASATYSLPPPTTRSSTDRRTVPSGRSPESSVRARSKPGTLATMPFGP